MKVRGKLPERFITRVDAAVYLGLRAEDVSRLLGEGKIESEIYLTKKYPLRASVEAYGRELELRRSLRVTQWSNVGSVHGGR